jgi:signal peptidase I
LIATVCLALVREIAWMPVSITGNSMAPTLRDGRLVGLNKVAYWRHPPQRGDIVGIWTGKELIIKRVIAIGGDEVRQSDGVFFINGEVLPEPYVHARDRHNYYPAKIPSGEFVVCGDNRVETITAMVSMRRIIGRVTP